jgi:hypothetical protein
MCRQVSLQTPRPVKTCQVFFALDAETHQPIAFTVGSSACTVAQATPELLRLAADILQPDTGQTLVLADAEHYTADLVEHVASDTPFLTWDAQHFADHLLAALDGDIRVAADTILVTSYNAPNADLLRHHYQGLPGILRAEGLDPHIPKHLRNREGLVGAVLVGVGKIFAPTRAHEKRG